MYVEEPFTCDVLAEKGSAHIESFVNGVPQALLREEGFYRPDALRREG